MKPARLPRLYCALLGLLPLLSRRTKPDRIHGGIKPAGAGQIVLRPENVHRRKQR